jgi:hypothetical protein
MGQEERKNKAKLEKTQIQLASNSNEYEAAVKVLQDTTGRWNKEWKSACDVSYRLSLRNVFIANVSIEIPRSGRRKTRFHKEQSVGLCKYCLDCMRERRCGMRLSLAQLTRSLANIPFRLAKKSVFHWRTVK